MESASKNRGRGRPRKFDDLVLDRIGGHQVGTHRQRQNRAYAALAHYVLREEAPEDKEAQVHWLTREPRKIGILSELGRMLYDPRFDTRGFWQVVDWLIENKPKTKVAVVALRRLRTGKRTPGSIDELRGELLQVIHHYRVRHPATTLRQIEAALQATSSTLLGR